MHRLPEIGYVQHRSGEQRGGGWQRGGARYGRSNMANTFAWLQSPAGTPTMNYLDELFYNPMKGNGGVRALYDRSRNPVVGDPARPAQITQLSVNGNPTNTYRPPSWKQVRAYHQAQEVNQLMRNRKAATEMVSRDY